MVIKSSATKKNAKKGSGSKIMNPAADKKGKATAAGKKKQTRIKGKIKAAIPDENKFEKKREEILQTLKEINILTKKTLLCLKELDAAYKKEIKSIKKNTKKNSGKNSGFNKPAAVPKTLQKILNLNDKPLARSHVAKLMYKYFDENNLYSPRTKKIIIPNKAMRTIFGMKKTEIIKFENFQTWLKNVYSEKDELVLDIND